MAAAAQVLPTRSPPQIGGGSSAPPPEAAAAAAAADQHDHHHHRPPTVLSSLIDSGSWPDVVDRLASHPDEASVPIERYHGPSLPLHEVCKRQPPELVVRALLDAYPAAASLPDPFSSSLPLHVAVQFGTSSGVVDELLETFPRAARRRADGEGGKLPVHLACRWGASVDVVERLMWVYPESVHVRDDAGMTPRMYAEEYASEEVAAMTDMARKGYCQVAKAASIRLQEDYDEHHRGTVSAHDAHVVDLVRTHASELSLRDAVEERLRSNLKRMKVHYSALEGEIRQVSSEKRRLLYVSRGGYCPPEDLKKKADKVDKLEDNLLDSMGRMSSMLREADAEEVEPRFVADVLESDLAARTEELRERCDDLAQSRNQVDDLLRRLDEVLGENAAQREEIRRLNGTVVRLAQCVDRLTVPRETLRRAEEERDRALEEVERSRRRFVLMGGEEEDDEGNNNCQAGSDSEEGYVWQMGPSPQAEGNETRRDYRRLGIGGGGGGSYEFRYRGKKGLEDDKDKMINPAFDEDSVLTKMIEEKGTMLTAITLSDSMLDNASLGERTHEETPRGDDDKTVVEGAPSLQEDVAISNSTEKDDAADKNNDDNGNECQQQQQLEEDDKKGGKAEQREESGEDKDDEKNNKKVLAIAENIDRSLEALQVLLSDNPEALAALRGTKSATARRSRGGGGKSKRRKGKGRPLPAAETSCRLGTLGEEEIELIRNDTATMMNAAAAAAAAAAGGSVASGEDADSAFFDREDEYDERAAAARATRRRRKMGRGCYYYSEDDDGFYGCPAPTAATAAKTIGRGFVVRGSEESTVEMSLISESNSILTNTWSFDGDGDNSVMTLNLSKAGAVACCSIPAAAMPFFSR